VTDQEDLFLEVEWALINVVEEDHHLPASIRSDVLEARSEMLVLCTHLVRQQLNDAQLVGWWIASAQSTPDTLRESPKILGIYALDECCALDVDVEVFEKRSAETADYMGLEVVGKRGLLAEVDVQHDGVLEYRPSIDLNQMSDKHGLSDTNITEKD